MSRIGRKLFEDAHATAAGAANAHGGRDPLSLFAKANTAPGPAADHRMSYTDDIPRCGARDYYEVCAHTPCRLRNVLMGAVCSTATAWSLYALTQAPGAAPPPR